MTHHLIFKILSLEKQQLFIKHALCTDNSHVINNAFCKMRLWKITTCLANVTQTQLYNQYKHGAGVCIYKTQIDVTHVCCYPVI